MKNEIKKWAKEEGDIADLMIRESLEELAVLDNLDMEGTLCEEGKERRVNLRKDIVINMYMVAISWRQKVREM